MKFLFSALLLILGCSKSSELPEHPKSVIPLDKPVVYARYDTLPALLRIKPGRCANAYAFKTPDKYRLKAVMDLCGPMPESADSNSKNLWLLPSGFKSLHWEQDTAPGQSLQMDLIGPNGLPLPTTTALYQIGPRLLVELKTNSILPKNVILTLAIYLVDSTGQKLSSQKVPFKITEP